MARYNVTPVGAGSTMWKVERNGNPISRHRKQQTAIAAARRDATGGDKLVIHKRGGQIREQRTVR